jgi:hypothetical protein
MGAPAGANVHIAVRIIIAFQIVDLDAVFDDEFAQGVFRVPSP